MINEITHKGQLEVEDTNGNVITIPGPELEPDEHIDGSGVTFGHDTGHWSVKRTYEKKEGAWSWGDWSEENCSVKKDDIIVELS